MNLKNRLLASGAFGGMTANERRLGRFIRDGEGHPDPAPTPTPEPAPAATPEPAPVDPFDAAFDNANKDDGVAEPSPAPTPAPASEPAPAPGEPAAAPKKDGDVTPDPTQTPAPGAPAGSDGGTPAATPAPASADDIVKGLADLLNKQPEPAPAAAPAAEAQPEAPVYTPEEVEILQEYEKNWSEVSRAENLKRRAEYSDIFKFVFTEMVKHTKPLFEQVQQVGNSIHLGELEKKVEGYTPALEEDVIKWIDSQPAYLHEPYKKVMQEGTSDEVADLFGRYRQATGNAPAPTPAAAPAAPGTPAPAAPAAKAKPATELSSAAIQAAESLAPVSGDRSSVPQGEDHGDYDSAFAKWSKESESA